MSIRQFFVSSHIARQVIYQNSIDMHAFAGMAAPVDDVVEEEAGGHPLAQQAAGQVGERNDHRVQVALGGLERQCFERERAVGGHGVRLPGSPDVVGAVDERRRGSTQAR